MPPKHTYLQYRNQMIRLGFNIQVCKLDCHYEMKFLYDSNNKLIAIL